MRDNLVNDVKVFANQFVSSIIEGAKNDEYYWEVYYNEYYNSSDELCVMGELTLYNSENDICGRLEYNIIRDERGRYTYNKTFEFQDECFNDIDEVEEFNIIKNEINLYEDGLYDKICAYIHKYAMDQLNSCEEYIDETLPTYEPYYSPSSIEGFMKKYGISSYVPIDVEIVDEKGLPIKNLTIKELGFNDEGNRLIISMREE